MPPLPLLENAPTVLGAARGAVRQSDADLKAESAVSMGRHILAGGGALASARGALEPTLPAEEVAVSKTAFAHNEQDEHGVHRPSPATKPKKERGEL